MHTRSPPFCWLGFGLTLLVAVQVGAQEADQATDPESDAPRTTQSAPGIEEIVIVGGESQAASDFAAADSVTGFGAEDLAALGAQTIADLASFTPNLAIVTAGATTPTFFIRGVGLNDFNPNSTGAVSIYQDNVAINAPAIQLGTLFDVEAVNVLRGPQGAGQARNSSAGAIKIYSRKPSGEFQAFLRMDFGNFGYQDYEGAVEAPIWKDVIAGRFAFRRTTRDGTMRNNCGNAPAFSDRVPFPGGFDALPNAAPWSLCGESVRNVGSVSDIPVGLAEHVNDSDNWAARGTLLFQPTLDMSWLLNAHGSKRDEKTRLGQSIGTGGNFCLDGKICKAPFSGVPPALVDRSAVSNGWLGGTVDGTSRGINYTPREILNRLYKLAPCEEFLNPSDPRSCRRQSVPDRLAANDARIQLSEQLAAGLDSEPHEGDFNRTGPTKNDAWGGYLRGEIALGGVDLTTTSAYDTYDRFVDIDLDFSPETLFQIITDDEAWQVYQDVTFTGQLGEATPLRWEIGGWFLHEKLDVEVFNDFGILSTIGVAFRDYSQETTSAAGYANLSFDFWDDFTLDGGFRYNFETKDFDLFQREGTGLDSEEDVSETWHDPTGTIRLTYRFREDTHAFWKYTRGWKPGSFNATTARKTGVTIADPESIDSFETGLRGSWFDGRLGLDASFFFYAYEDYQIFTAQQFLGGNPEFVILNANNAEVYGTEMDVTARPWDGAFWNVRFSWLESQFLDFQKSDQFLAARGGQDLIIFKQTQNSGNALLNSPRFKVSMTAEQTLRVGRFGSFTLRYDGVWTDITYYDPTEGVGLGTDDGTAFLPNNTIAQEDFWLHNLRLSWRAPVGGIEIAGWVRNIEDTAYKTFAFDGSTFRTTTIYFVGEPRTYGGSLIINF